MLTLEMIDYYHDNPTNFFEDILQVTPTKQQKEIISHIPIAIKEKKNISVKSGHGTGKTFIESGLIIWFLVTRYKSKVICTAPTAHQLFDVLWSELAKHNDKSVLKNLFEWTATRFAYKESNADWFAVARSSAKPENIQGFHAENMLILVDEASGMDDAIMEAIEGAATEEGNIIMMFGNPTRLSGTFYDSFNTKKMFYHTMTMSCLDSTNVSQKYIEQIKTKYGEDSNVYRVRVLGEFPDTEEDTLISIEQINKAIEREVEINNETTIEFGVDVARFGSDETTIYKRIGKKITQEWISDSNTTMEIVGQVVNRVKNNIDKFSEIIINIDDTGVGGGVTDRLKELSNEGQLPMKVKIFGINNQSKAHNKKLYKNTITELWFFMRDFIKECSIPKDSELVQQLSARRYGFNSDGRMMVESKDAMKDRGLHSPDRADAVLLCCKSLVSNTDLNITSTAKDRYPKKEEIENDLFKRIEIYKRTQKNRFAR